MTLQQNNDVMIHYGNKMTLCYDNVIHYININISHECNMLCYSNEIHHAGVITFW